MPRETKIAKRNRTHEILERLRATYPTAHCELNYSSPLELLIATILSAQCTDKQVNLVTQELFRKYRTARDYAEADLSNLEQDVRRIGLFRNKAKNIQACCRKLMQNHKGEVPRTMEELIELDGVGRKTANVVLGNAFGIPSGIVVDTHVGRLANLLRLSSAAQPERIEHDLQELVPQKLWVLWSHLLIWHGRRRCAARRPDCVQCEIRSLCPSRARDEAS